MSVDIEPTTATQLASLSVYNANAQTLEKPAINAETQELSDIFSSFKESMKRTEEKLDANDRNFKELRNEIRQLKLTKYA